MNALGGIVGSLLSTLSVKYPEITLVMVRHFKYSYIEYIFSNTKHKNVNHSIKAETVISLSFTSRPQGSGCSDKPFMHIATKSNALSCCDSLIRCKFKLMCPD